MIKIEFDTIATLIDFERKSDFQSDNRLKSSKKNYFRSDYRIKTHFNQIIFQKKSVFQQKSKYFL